MAVGEVRVLAVHQVVVQQIFVLVEQLSQIESLLLVEAVVPITAVTAVVGVV